MESVLTNVTDDNHNFTYEDRPTKMKCNVCGCFYSFSIDHKNVPINKKLGARLYTCDVCSTIKNKEVSGKAFNPLRLVRQSFS